MYQRIFSSINLRTTLILSLFICNYADDFTNLAHLKRHWLRFKEAKVVFLTCTKALQDIFPFLIQSLKSP